MMYSHNEFDSYIRGIAKVNVTIPAGYDGVVYDISAPPDGLVLRVDPKIGLDGQWMGGSPEVKFVSRTGDEKFVDNVPSQRWDRRLGEVVTKAMKNWREYMIQ
jgi:hypothetical protein